MLMMLASYEKEMSFHYDTVERLHVCECYIRQLKRDGFLTEDDASNLFILPYNDFVTIELAAKAVQNDEYGILLGKIISELINVFEEGYCRDMLLKIILKHTHVKLKDIRYVFHSEIMFGSRLVRELNCGYIYYKMPQLRQYLDCCIFDRNSLQWIE